MVNVACPLLPRLYDGVPTTLNSEHGTDTVPEIGLLVLIVNVSSRLSPMRVAGNANVSGVAVPAVDLTVAEHCTIGQLDVPVRSRLSVQVRSPTSVPPGVKTTPHCAEPPAANPNVRDGPLKAKSGHGS